MARVAVVIVTYNSQAEIGGCLAALRGLPNLEIVVVDNASTDDTCREVGRHNLRLRDLRLLANHRNAGFAGAVNQGVRVTEAPLVLLLNPDAHLMRGLDVLAAQFEVPGTGAAGGLLIGADGSPQTGFMARNLPTPTALIFEVLGVNRLWPHNPVNWYYRCLEDRWDMPHPVGQPAGAFLMFSREAFVKVGGFDERFWPVWFEDVDFCARLTKAGFRVVYHPDAVAKHSGGHSVGALRLEIRQRYWYGSLLEYGAKHYSPLTFRSLCFAVVIGAVFRAVPAGLMQGSVTGGLKAFAVYGAVIRLAVRRMFRLQPKVEGITAV